MKLPAAEGYMNLGDFCNFLKIGYFNIFEITFRTSVKPIKRTIIAKL